MQNLHAVTPCSNQQQPIRIHSDLFTQSHVFVCHDAVRKPLQPPYDGSYRVISRTKKHFTIEIKGRYEVVSASLLRH